MPSDVVAAHVYQCSMHTVWNHEASGIFRPHAFLTIEKHPVSMLWFFSVGVWPYPTMGTCPPEINDLNGSRDLQCNSTRQIFDPTPTHNPPLMQWTPRAFFPLSFLRSQYSLQATNIIFFFCTLQWQVWRAPVLSSLRNECARCFLTAFRRMSIQRYGLLLTFFAALRSTCAKTVKKGFAGPKESGQSVHIPVSADTARATCLQKFGRELACPQLLLHEVVSKRARPH